MSIPGIEPNYKRLPLVFNDYLVLIPSVLVDRLWLFSRRLLISARVHLSISRFFLFVMRNVAPIETLHVRLTSNF